MGATPLTEILMNPPFWLALLAAVLLAGGAYLLRWLTLSGAVSTFLVGLLIYYFGGGFFIIPLLTFFLSSSLLSHLGRSDTKAEATTAPRTKGATRDAAQVWANGGVAVAMTLTFFWAASHSPSSQNRIWLVFYLAALSAVNADTWATEWGRLSRQRPRLLTNWQVVEPGISGAISPMGLLGALLGAALIPLSVGRLWHLDGVEFSIALWAGFLGSLLDSVLGASVQAQYQDPVTGDTSELPQVAGRRMERVRGVSWLNNDGVNFLASLGGVLFAWALLRLSVWLLAWLPK